MTTRGKRGEEETTSEGTGEKPGQVVELVARVRVTANGTPHSPGRRGEGGVRHRKLLPVGASSCRCWSSPAAPDLAAGVCAGGRAAAGALGPGWETLGGRRTRVLIVL